MSEPYKIFGSEMSPYSIKIRSYFRFKGLPHLWVQRRPENEDAYKRYARLPIIPTVVTPDDQGLQDSTPIMEAVEAKHPQPSIHPDEPVLAFLSTLIEEFGDEWGNKLMFHHRWYSDLDQRASAQILARLALPHGTAMEVADRAVIALQRMSGRGHFVGSSDATAPLISDYYFALLDVLEKHLARRKYLFGARPCFGDFGLAAQLFEASIDPTCSAGIRSRGPAVLDWCYRMNEPRIDGGLESWDELAPTLMPLLTYIGSYFLPWTRANAKALQDGAASFTVELPGGAYTQPPQKYHARSYAVLKAKYAAVAGDRALKSILDGAGCTPHLV